MKKNTFTAIISFIAGAVCATGTCLYLRHIEKAEEQEKTLMEISKEMQDSYNRLNNDAIMYEYEKYGGFAPVQLP